MTCKDFEIGEEVVIIEIEESQKIFYEEHYIIGKSYVVQDTDFHFQNKICLRNESGQGMFVPIKWIDKRSYIRDKKINQILK